MATIQFLKRFGIGGKLVLCFLAVALLPLLVAGSLAIQHAASALEDEVTANLSTVGDAKARQIDNYFSEARHNLSTLAHNPSLIDALERFIAAFNNGGVGSPEYVAADDDLRPFLTYYQEYYEEEVRYYDLFLISPEGDIVFTVMKEDDFATNLLTGAYRDTELARTFQTAAASHVAEISDFRYYSPSEEPAAFIAAPVFKEGRLIGVLALQMSVQQINKLARDYTGLGETGETVFVSKEDDEIVFVSPLRHDPDAAFRRRVSMGAPTALPAQQALQGRKGSGVSTDYRGEEILATWRYVPDVRWGIVTKMDTREAFISARRLQQWFLVVGTITMLAVAVAAVLVSRSISGPITQLTGSVKRIAAGSLAERVDINSADEIGQLATEFNQMAERLQEKVAEVSEQEARTTTILNSTADGIMTIDENGTVISFNAAAGRLFGYDSVEVVGRNVSMLVPALNQKLAKDNPDTNLSPGESRTIGGESEVEGLHQSGNTIPLALRLAEMNYQDERIFIATVQDIAERKQSEQERQRLFEVIREVVGRLSSASSEVLASASQQTESAESQAAGVSQIVTTINEITQTAEHSVERAEQVSSSAERADEVSRSGRVAIDATTTAMQSVRDHAETTAENILALAERAQTIGEITETVNNIADRTNMLALNAAVEASRAGEHGKGFGVVASEVKSLAQQAKTATKQIGQILREIQQATNTAVVSTEQGTRSVAEASSVVTQAAATIDTLAATIGEAARAASQIVATSGQQATGMNQISQSMTHIDQTARQTLAATQQFEQLAEDLQELGDHLRQLTDS